MSHQYVNVVVPKESVDAIIELGGREGVTLAAVSAPKGAARTVSFLATLKAQQGLVDDLQQALHATADWQIAICPVSAVVAKAGADDEPHEISETREELLAEITRNARLTPNFLTLVAISAVVAALGMIRDNVSAIIGVLCLPRRHTNHWNCFLI
jgi:hypothetical protein